MATSPPQLTHQSPPGSATDRFRSVVATALKAPEHNRGLPGIYRQALNNPLGITPGPMLAALADVSDTKSITIDELAARDALALWATVTRASNSHHQPGVGPLGRRAWLAAHNATHETAYITTISDIANVRTRVELLGHLHRLLRMMQSVGISADYVELAVDLRRIYWGTTTTELDPSVAGRWVRDFHLPPSDD